MSNRRCRLAVKVSQLVACVALMLTAAPAMAQTADSEAETRPSSVVAPLTAGEVESRRKQAEHTPDLSDDIKSKVAELYRQALDELQRAEQLKTQANEDKVLAENVPQRVAEIRVELEALKTRQPEAPGESPLPELEQKLSAKDLQLKELKNTQAKKEAAPTTRANRRKEIRALLLAVPQKLDELKKQLETPAPADEPAPLTLARQTELIARRKLLEQEPAALQNELAKYDAQEAADQLRLERDKVAQQIALVQKEFDLLNEAVRRKRDEEAQAAVRRAQEEAIEAQPRLMAYAEENKRLAEEAQSLTQLIEKADEELQRVKQRLEEVQRQFEQTKNKVESVGLTGVIGLMLRKQHAELPNLRKRNHNLQTRRPVINDAQFALFDYDDARSDLSDLEPHIRRILASAPRSLDAEERTRLQEAATTVLERKRDYLDPLIRSYGTYFDTLVELDSTERQLIKLTNEYQNYIDERVLWIRSGKPLHADFQLDPSDSQLVSATQWRALLGKIWEDARGNPHMGLCVMVVFLTLLRVGRGFRRDLSEIGEFTSRSNCAEFVPTLRAALLTVLISVPWPMLLLAVGWRLASISSNDELLRGIGQGLLATGWAFFAMELVRQVCRGDGLADAHFDWPSSVVADLGRNLRNAMLWGLPLVMFTSTLQASDPQHGQDVLERLGFLMGAVVLALFLRRVLSPSKGILREHIQYHPHGWLDRLKHVICWASVASPLALAGMSFLGYHYTARQLSFRLFVTLSLLLMLIILHAMLLRLVLVVRRRLSIEEARRRRAERNETQSQLSSLSPFSPQHLLGQVSLRVDIAAQSLQTRRLVGTAMVALSLLGLWLIWADVVPALGFLDRWPLWTTTITVTEALAEGNAAGAAQTHEQLVNITFADVGLAVLIAIITFAAARNVPGLLEIALLQRLPLEHSVRYAITSLASYAIVLVGVIAGCNVIGLRWSQIQWLATALTFGLAFGLQEMFANFIAGLILLFERPIRVGDVVTVDETTGVVSRIRMRATTITNWDRKEFVVPNKEFITGKLLNWTLSDQVNRLVVNVGIAYGSDTELAKELLQKTAEENALVLKDPPPIATFEGFGDSCLNFSLRAFLSTMESRLPVIHDLHSTINKAFQDAGIEIAFPQRDLHVRSVPTGLVRAMNQSRPAARDEPKDSKSAA